MRKQFGKTKSEQDPETTAGISFSEWVKGQSGRRDRHAALGQGAKDDKHWPRGSDIDDFRELLKSERAPMESMYSLEFLWREWASLSRRPSRIYFIQKYVTLSVKIGCSTIVKARLATASTMSDEDVSIIAALRGGYKMESLLHSRFRRFHLRKEWFSPSSELIDFCKGFADSPETAFLSGKDDAYPAMPIRFLPTITRFRSLAAVA